MKLPRTIWLRRSLLLSLIDEAQGAAPSETGGMLLGYDGRAEPVVMNVIGPGPRAIHESCRFVPDHEYQVARIEQLYNDSNRRLQYLGDWHTHPKVRAFLSEQDRITMKLIASCKEARCAQPIMLVMGQERDWRPALWIGALVPSGMLLRRRLVTRRLQLRVYE